VFIPNIGGDMSSVKTPRSALSRIIRREYADRYILLALISFAGSISVTRLFLSLSGYPRIESGNLHIAHVLWGGLLLFIASLLPLIFANRWVYSVGALLGGVGIGLFIDEVGKFITVTNDYFFPAAAPIIYVFFLLTILVLIQIRMMRDHNENIQLHKALDKIHDILELEVSPKEQKELAEQIEILMLDEQPGKKRDLEKTIVEFLKIDVPESEKKDSPKRKILNSVSSILLRIWRFISVNIRTILIVGTIGIGLLNLKNPAGYLLQPVLPGNIVDILEMNIGRQVSPQEAQGFYQFRVYGEIIIGFLMIFSSILLMTKHRFTGCLIGTISFLLCLMVIDFILFYFEQFSTIITTSIQFLLFLGYLYYLTKLTAKPGRLVHATIKPY
jgi:hypothetical protein